MAAQRNTGLMVAATSGALPDLTWLYFGLCQFPIYLSPQLLKSVVRRLLDRPSVTPAHRSGDKPNGARARSP
jgi:BASS family bile acid:Na+ symporter